MRKPQAMQRPGSIVNGATNQGEQNAVSVFRVEEGNRVFARTLSEHYVGCMTHWYKGRTHYCAGKDCRDVMHRSCDRTWKGYAAVEIHAGGTTWVPFVLEISEALELDMRGKFQRGQIWRISREEGNGRRPTPMLGKLHEQRDPDSFPPAFDIRSVILSLYHVEKIDLSVKNPMPPRIVLGKSQDAPPASEEGSETKIEEATPEMQQRIDDARERLYKKLGMPLNGKH